MADNNSINIGGVRFNQQDVKKSEVVKQGDKQMNSVFLNDGTHNRQTMERKIIGW